MSYIPLNKIVTNLYTNGEEYQFPNGGDEYVGFYYKLYTGEIKTGKTPNDLPNSQIIIPLKPLENTSSPKTLYIPAFTADDGPPFPSGMNDDNTIIMNNQAYTYLNNGGVVKDVILNIPNQSFPIPTNDDYKLGSFTRYFCVKSNENSYLEINKDTYKSLRGKFKGWDWVNYITFKIPWTLTGVEREVQQVNYNITTLQEERNSKPGFKLFLKYNYTKFYQPPPQGVNAPITSSSNTPPIYADNELGLNPNIAGTQ